jgi:hypothetical protein
MDHFSILNLLMTLALAVLGGGGAAKLFNIAANRGTRRADVATSLSKSMLDWAQETADDAAAARRSAAVAHEQVDALHVELRQLRAEVEMLAWLMRSIRAEVYSPAGSIEHIRQLLERTPYDSRRSTGTERQSET